MMLKVIFQQQTLFLSKFFFLHFRLHPTNLVSKPFQNTHKMTLNTLSTLFSYAHIQVPIFEGVHFEYWSSQMGIFFLSQNLWDVVEDGYAEPPESGSS